MSWHCVGPGLRPRPASAADHRVDDRRQRRAQRGAVGRRRRAGAAARLDDAVEQRRTNSVGQTCSSPWIVAMNAPRPAPRAAVFAPRCPSGVSPCVGGAFRSLKMRGELTIAACCRIRQRHLDHLDAEQRGVRDPRPACRRSSPAARSASARRRRAGDVDVDVLLVLRILDHRVRVRAAAGLHVARCTSGCAMSVMSKMRMPRRRSVLTVSCTPCVPQSRRPSVPSPDTKSRFL